MHRGACYGCGKGDIETWVNIEWKIGAKKVFGYINLLKSLFIRTLYARAFNTAFRVLKGL